MRFGDWFLAASDEHPLGRQALERGIGRAGFEPAIDGDSSWSDPQLLELGDRAVQPRLLCGVAEPRRGGQDQGPRAGLLFSVTSASWLTNRNSFG